MERRLQYRPLAPANYSTWHRSTASPGKWQSLESYVQRDMGNWMAIATLRKHPQVKANVRSWRTWFDLGSMAFMLYLATSPALAASSTDYKLQISGKLVKPPCTPQFPATMPIHLGQISGSDLSASRSATTGAFIAALLMEMSYQ